MRQEMIDASVDAWARFGKHERKAEDCLQAGINAAWTDFDPQDKSTWPKSEYAPSGMNWIVCEKDLEHNSLEEISIKRWFDNYDNVARCWRLVIRYADPASFLPQESE